MQPYCPDSKNSQLIVDRFLKTCEMQDILFMAGPSGSEFMLLINEFCRHFKVDQEGVILLQIGMLQERTLSGVQQLLNGRKPGVVAVETRGNVDGITEKGLLRFLERPAFSGARYFVFLEDVDPFDENGAFPKALLNRAKESLFILPPLSERLADLAHFTLQLFRRYEEEYQSPQSHRLVPEATKWILNYNWPGNYQELSSVVRVLVASGFPEGLITLDRLENAVNLGRTRPID